MPRKTFYTREQALTIQSFAEQILQSPDLLSAFFTSLEGGKEYDLFGTSLLAFATAANVQMKVLYNVIAAEFEKNKATPTSIMRGNTVASRIMGIFCKRVGTEYLNKNFSEFLFSVARDENLDFELDVEKMVQDGLSQEKAESKVAENKEKLIHYFNQLLAIINDPDVLYNVPRKIRALAFFTWDLANKYHQENPFSLVGGFIILRFINPVLLTPEIYDIVPRSGEGALTMKARRNLTYLTKLLQNISNKTLFNEASMLQMNPFLEENFSMLEGFLQGCIEDPHGSEGTAPFSDFLDCTPTPFPPEAVEFAAIDFFDEIFELRKDSVISNIIALSTEARCLDIVTDFLEKMTVYGDDTPPLTPLHIYYSPLCPYSLATWMFCLLNNLPIELHKIDLFKDDHSLDNVYKKFVELSPSMQVPLLVDNGFCLEESNAILSYLCEKFLLPNNWYPRIDIGQWAKCNSLMEWMLVNVQYPLSRLWKSLKNPQSLVLSVEGYEELVENLSILNAFYRESAGPFLFGSQPSIVDLTVGFSFGLSRLIHGLKTTSYPQLTQLVAALQKNNTKVWKTVAFEFEHFSQYINSFCTLQHTSKISHTVIFQDSVHTVYERILDPDNELFLMLASKTISTKANAKLKKGLKTLNKDGSAEIIEMADRDKEPYVISLDVGGGFNVNNREGTNLLLVPGNFIVQVSHMKDWPAGQFSIDIFEFIKIDNSTCRLKFVQLNSPLSLLTPLEEFWGRFWRKLNGIRVQDLHQNIFFRQKVPGDIFPLISDPLQLAKALKQKTKADANGCYLLHNKGVVARVKEIVSGKEAVQEWRATDWPDDHWSLCTQSVDFCEGGCRLLLEVLDVPHDKLKVTDKIWKKHVWSKLSGINCSEVNYELASNEKPNHLYHLLTDSDELTKLYKTKCLSSSSVGTNVQIGNYKGQVLELVPNQKVVFRMSHPQWSNQHPSIISFQMEGTPYGTTLRSSHKNVPEPNLPQVVEWWQTELCEKLQFTIVEKITTSTVFEASPRFIYSILVDSMKLTRMTGRECHMIPEVNGDIAINDKSTKGKIVTMVQDSTLCWSVRDYDWPISHFSQMTFRLFEHGSSDRSHLLFQQTNIPHFFLAEATSRWEAFAKQLKTYISSNNVPLSPSSSSSSSSVS
eukprot:TRINITY_DN17724_c0_g1_i1.p1 TRINITY_DN17724_c0_g1~~TRINITY_DN17724_c0_g1_i1.p1  ORF type:complete len:1143 (+),score=548.99 TRINITY_DN17724_c0_g1_i1:292-3720(+)